MSISPNVQSILQGILTATDNTQSPAPYLINLDFQNPSMLSENFFYDTFLPAATSPGTVVNLGTGATPAAYMILVINRSAANNVQINIQPTGQSTVNAGTLGPGGVFLAMDPTQSSLGWTGLTLIGIGAVVPCTVYSANQG